MHVLENWNLNKITLKCIDNLTTHQLWVENPCGIHTLT